jgi:hypothetical protein
VLTSATNIGLSATPPAEYLPEVEKRFPGALAKQCVPGKPELWELENFELFLQERRQLLASAINDLMGSLTESVPTETIADAAELIALGEGAAIEFKSSLRWDVENQQTNKALEKVVAKTIAGFLNAEGGVLLMGVADDGAVLGLEDDLKTLGAKQDHDGFGQRLVSVVNNYLGVELAPFWQLRFDQVNGGEVAVVSVDRCPIPVFLTDGDKKEFYARVGGTTQPMDVEAATAYIALHWDN